MKYQTRVYRKCANCQGDFWFYSRELEHSSCAFCSPRCYNTARAGKVSFPCPVCDRSFTSYKSDKRKTCSRRCAARWKSINQQGRVITWGHKISDSRRGVPNLKLRGRTLGHEHRRKIGEAKRGEKCTFWKGGVSKENNTVRDLIMETIEYKDWRSAVFKRDSFTCTKCGGKNSKLNAHHIESFAEYPEKRFDVDNGMTLCINCHRKTHADFFKDILT